MVFRPTFSDRLLWHITNLKFEIMEFAIILAYFALIQKINKASRKGFDFRNSILLTIRFCVTVWQAEVINIVVSSMAKELYMDIASI